MALVLVFLFGIANFAAHKAVLESGHPLLGQLPWLFRGAGLRPSLILEFVLLASALAMSDPENQAASAGWSFAYGAYSVLNLLSAWLIVNRRV